jgi:uncharacterized repeat protein (TIGR03806 family)
VTTLTFPTSVPTPGTVSTAEAFPNLPNFDLPVFVTAPPGDTNRVFVVEQTGKIRVFQNTPSVSSSTVFLDIPAHVSTFWKTGEQGLLGLAFHPDYANNKTFYVYYSANLPIRSVIARYKVTGANANVADPTTATILMSVTQPDNTNHKAGMIGFGSDGYLYIALGDGGSQGDPGNRALDKTQLLGKILRVGVGVNDAANVYSIPTTNPFASSTGNERKEIYAWGFRNPWRWSFDRVTGRMWCGDVGGGAREEIDIVEKGKNYGWRAKEGTTTHSSGDLDQGPFTDPVWEYGRSTGSCIIGGYVYHGTTAPSLGGAYLYADHNANRIWALTWDGNTVTSNTEVDTVENPSSFGEDASGEVYVCELFTGRIRKFVESGGGGGGPFPQKLSDTGIFANVQTLEPNPGLVPYDVNVPLWSDDAMKDRLIALPGNETIEWSQDDAWEFPVGTCLVKTFRLPTTVGDPNTAVRLETRVLVNEQAGWAGYVYRWRDDQTDADLIPGTATRTLTITDPAAPGGTRQQTWTFPSRTDCTRCHTLAAGRVLGLTTRQLNREFDYGAASDNQLRTWDHIGLFDDPIPANDTLPAHPAPGDTSATVASRARAYLDVNCSMCHRPGGPSQADIDLRGGITVDAMGVVDVRPSFGNMGLSDPWLVRSGDATRSVLWLRMGATNENRMPPLATSLVDSVGSGLVRAWVDGGP